MRVVDTEFEDFIASLSKEELGALMGEDSERGERCRTVLTDIVMNLKRVGALPAVSPLLAMLLDFPEEGR